MDPWRDIAKLSSSEIKDLQNRKLHHFINRQLYPFSPHYQKLFDQNKIDPKQIRTAADLKGIPFTSKSDFIDSSDPAKFKEYILQPDEQKIRKHWPLAELLKLKMLSLTRGKAAAKAALTREYRPVFMTFTSGTTGYPITYFYSNYDINNLHVSGSRMVSLFDIAENENLVNIFPFAPHLAFWQVLFGGLAANKLVLSTGGGKVMGTTGNIAAILKMRPAVIIGVPSYVYHILRQAREEGRKMDFVKKIVLGAAKVTIPFKQKIVELLAEMGAKNVAVFGTYGFTEARCAWAECPSAIEQSSGYHLYPDKEIFEIIDPKTGEVKGQGEDGELVYTSIDSRASSVIRYRTGDFVKGGINWEPCPYCKRTVPRISSDITRITDTKDMQFSKIKGSLVNFNHFSICFTDFKEIEEWQIELCKRNNDPYDVDELNVYLSVDKGVNEASLAEAVKTKLMNMTEVSPNQINFIPLSEMIKRLELETANKEKRILDTRPKV